MLAHRKPNLPVDGDLTGLGRPKCGQGAALRTNHRVGAGERRLTLRLQGQPDAVGEGVLPVDGAEAAIRVAAPEASGGAFVFYFSADQQ